VQGWLFRKTGLAERLLLVAAGLLLVYPKPMFDAVGIGLVAAVAATQLGFLPRLRNFLYQAWRNVRKSN